MSPAERFVEQNDKSPVVAAGWVGADNLPPKDWKVFWARFEDGTRLRVNVRRHPLPDGYPKWKP